ncbi:unnamed protein product [Mycena citricolor]|uniref:Uncharacterized protein n=1 Tax=Mycena citricolor TaxID=2018698 RepID=A0AAD2K6F4_9AGAR|nr:unnamed protein product [Mycena citricolor]
MFVILRETSINIRKCNDHRSSTSLCPPPSSRATIRRLVPWRMKMEDREVEGIDSTSKSLSQPLASARSYLLVLHKISSNFSWHLMPMSQVSP